MSIKNRNILDWPAKSAKERIHFGKSGRLAHLLINKLLIFLLVGCQSENPSPPTTEQVPAEELLEQYETVVALEDNLLAQPYILSFDSEYERLLIYDSGHVKVLELDLDGNMVHEYAREGQGPGEIIIADNLFLTDSHIYIYDPNQYFIHRYEREGGFDGSLGLEDVTRPFQTLDSSNQPVVTLRGHLLHPSAGEGQTLFELTDWYGNRLSHVGEIPEGTLSTMDDQDYRVAIERQEVPPINYSRAFPVVDQANPDEFFIVYSSTGRIAKYNTSGEKLWDQDIPVTTEVETIANDHFELAERLTPGSRHPHRRYVTGVSTEDGELYLAVYTNFVSPIDNRPLWIHRFNDTGELIGRYKLVSDPDVDLLTTFGVDADRRLIYVPAFQEGEIRAYSF